MMLYCLLLCCLISLTAAAFAYLTIDDVSKMESLPDNRVQKKWWAYMKDIMETNEDNSPIRMPLKEVFYLP